MKQVVRCSFCDREAAIAGKLVNGLSASICCSCIECLYAIYRAEILKFPEDYDLDEQAKAAVRIAKREALVRNQTIGPAHILLGLLKENCRGEEGRGSDGASFIPTLMASMGVIDIVEDHLKRHIDA